jgi:hypothetical protein
MRRTLGTHFWNDYMFAELGEETSFESLCERSWRRYRSHLFNSTDGILLAEQYTWNSWRQQWINKEVKIKCIYRSKRIIPYETTLERCLRWSERIKGASIPQIPKKNLELLRCHPQSFLLPKIRT